MANRVGNFFKEIQGELKRVSWPSREEVIGSTVIVITLTFILAVYIGVIDFFLSMIIRFLVR